MLLDHESDNDSDYLSYAEEWSASEDGSAYDWSEEEDLEPHEVGSRACQGTLQARPSMAVPSKFELLPLELVLEVCRLLHPWDVLALARTNKRLRRVLTSKKSEDVWKATWRNADGAPSCPDDQSYMQWTQLLFGTECTLCWRNYKVRTIHWALRARPCKDCIKTEFVSLDTVDSFPSFSNDAISEALKILPSSYELLDRECDEVFSTWLRSDVLATLEALKELRERQDSNVALERYKEERSFHAKNRDAIRDNGREWHSQYRSNKRAARRKLLAYKLIELGHEKRDVLPCVIRSKRTSELTERYWEVLRPKYEQWIEQIKAFRIHRERLHVIVRNVSVASTLWKDYKRTEGEEDPFTPYSIDNFPGFTEAIQSTAPLTEVTIQLQTAMDNLPAQLKEWRRNAKLCLLKKIAEGLQFGVSESLTAEQVQEELQRHSEGVHIVFTCSQRSNDTYFFSDILKHQCGLKDWTFSCVTFDTLSSRVIAETTRKAGLDPKLATAEDLDRANARFICKNCPLLGGSSYARNWRNCIVHAHEHKDETQSSWDRLDDHTTAMVIEYENLSCKASRMMCLICPQSNARWGYADKSLERHFQSCHKKSPSPEEYVADPRLPVMPLQPIRVPTWNELDTFRKECDQEHLDMQAKLEENRRIAAAKREQEKVFKCTHCKTLGTSRSSRRFQRDGVLSHLKSVHHVTTPLMDADYYSDGPVQ